MAEKFAQTMLTLAEDNRDVKTSLRLMLKYEVHSLLDRLADLGEDAMLILANTSEGTTSHIGTPNATSFLGICQNSYNLNLKDTFLKFCTSNSGNTTGNIATGGSADHGTYQKDAEIWKDTKLPQMQQNNQAMMNQATQVMANLQNFVVKQTRMPINRFSPYGQPNMPNTNMSNNLQQNSMQQPFNKNFMGGGGGGGGGGGFQSGNNNMFHQLAQGFNNSSNNQNLNTDQKRRKRHVCRHYIKGHCWQGNMCAFLHTRDPQIIESLGGKTDKTSKSDATGEQEQATSSSHNNEVNMEPVESKPSDT